VELLLYLNILPGSCGAKYLDILNHGTNGTCEIYLSLPPVKMQVRELQ